MEHVGRTVACRLRSRMERQKNKEMGGPLAFDGRHLMRGHNNQIKVGVDVGGGVGEKRRPRKNVWGGCCLFVPGGELRGIKIKNKLRRGLKMVAGRRNHTTTNQKHARVTKDI